MTRHSSSPAAQARARQRAAERARLQAAAVRAREPWRERIAASIAARERDLMAEFRARHDDDDEGRP